MNRGAKGQQARRSRSRLVETRPRRDEQTAGTGGRTHTEDTCRFSLESAKG